MDELRERIIHGNAETFGASANVHAQMCIRDSRNTERFAAERGVALITVETLYDAKAHFGR